MREIEVERGTKSGKEGGRGRISGKEGERGGNREQ